jgi:hypothetical protein
VIFLENFLLNYLLINLEVFFFQLASSQSAIFENKAAVNRTNKKALKAILPDGQ